MDWRGTSTISMGLQITTAEIHQDRFATRRGDVMLVTITCTHERYLGRFPFDSIFNNKRPLYGGYRGRRNRTVLWGKGWMMLTKSTHIGTLRNLRSETTLEAAVPTCLVGSKTEMSLASPQKDNKRLRTAGEQVLQIYLWYTY